MNPPLINLGRNLAAGSRTPDFLVYIFILTLYAVYFHAHSPNGSKHIVNPSPRSTSTKKLGCRTPDTKLTFLCTTPVTYEV